MTKNSYICNFIVEHPQNWRDLLAEKQIKVKESGDYAIFNYGVMADFSDPIVQEARGIILNVGNVTFKDNYQIPDPEVVSWPFRKFGNSHETYVDHIDWNNARVQEKIDGSIVKLWYDKYKSQKASECFRWSSNSCIDAEEANLSSGLTIDSLIRRTDEWKYLQNLIMNNELDPQNTYIFELVSPKNQVVIRYDKTQLYHIGTRDNVTGKELGTGQFAGFIMSPKEYPLHSLEDCIIAVKELNKAESIDDNKDNYPDHEGFVVVDDEFHRIKVKSPEYLFYHHAITNGQINKEQAYEILSSDDFNLETFIKSVPEYIAEAIMYYKLEFENAEKCVCQIIELARTLKRNGSDRKGIAEIIKNNKYCYYGFKALDSDKTPEEILKEAGKKIIMHIKDYDSEKEDNK